MVKFYSRVFYHQRAVTGAKCIDKPRGVIAWRVSQPPPLQRVRCTTRTRQPSRAANQSRERFIDWIVITPATIPIL